MSQNTKVSDLEKQSCFYKICDRRLQSAEKSTMVPIGKTYSSACLAFFPRKIRPRWHKVGPMKDSVCLTRLPTPIHKGVGTWCCLHKGRRPPSAAAPLCGFNYGWVWQGLIPKIIFFQTKQINVKKNKQTVRYCSKRYF
jgi:hypothetical protein